MTRFAVCLIAALCVGGPALAAPPTVPDPGLTPGAINPAITQANIARTICIHGYTARAGIRHVTAATKKKIFAEYGVDPRSGSFEVDHLVSLEIGGSNDIRNLWPQSYTTKPLNAHRKDVLENKLHALVCSGAITLGAAQHAISTDWPGAYREYVANNIKVK